MWSAADLPILESGGIALKILAEIPDVVVQDNVIWLIISNRRLIFLISGRVVTLASFRDFSDSKYVRRVEHALRKIEWLSIKICSIRCSVLIRFDLKWI